LPGNSLEKAIASYHRSATEITIPSDDEIVGKLLATHQPHQTEASLRQLLQDQELRQLTQNDSLVYEQLVFPIAQFDVEGQREHILSVYRILIGKRFDRVTAAFLTRAAFNHFPMPFDHAQTTILHENKSLDPGGIDLSKESDILKIKRDAHGFPLPVQFQDFAMVHLDGLTPKIENIRVITDLSSYLGIK